MLQLLFHHHHSFKIAVFAVSCWCQSLLKSYKPKHFQLVALLQTQEGFSTAAVANNNFRGVQGAQPYAPGHPIPAAQHQHRAVQFKHQPLGNSTQPSMRLYRHKSRIEVQPVLFR